MIAVDTNVLIYACDQADARRQKIALDLVTNAQDGGLLWQVACEFISASRKLHKQGFMSAQAWNRLVELRDLLPLVLPSDSVLVRAKTTLPVDAKRARGRVGLLDTPEAVAPTLSVGRQSATIGATAIPDELRISMAGLLLPQPRTYSGCIGN